MKFGHHQSFYLRVNWLAKAMKMLGEDPRFFYDEFGFERIGLGRNMVKSLRYWVTAAGVVEEARDEERRPYHRLSAFGELLRDHDRFVRLPLTAAALHVMIASDKEQASTWYWFFNENNAVSGSTQEWLDALNGWASLHSHKAVSVNTLKRDLDCLKMTYTARVGNGDDPEEVVASPLSELGLLYETKDQFAKRSLELRQLDLDGLYFCLLHYCNRQQVNSVTLEEIQVKPMLWGRLFHLSPAQILEALELLHADARYPVAFVRTNQIYSLNIDVEDAMAFLQKAYQWKAAY